MTIKPDLATVALGRAVIDLKAERDALRAENERLRAERLQVEADLAQALELDPINDTRRVLDLLTHALAIVQD